jgi:hypothetical protein
MHAQRVLSTVDENGVVHIGTDLPKGTRVEVIVLPLEEELPTAVSAVAMQAQGGFVKEVLGNPAEDVWNDL